MDSIHFGQTSSDCIEILTTGDELVEGRLTDTNSAWMSTRLFEAGLKVIRHTSVGDDRAGIRAALLEAAGRAGAVLVSGGLGPTTDDLTAEVAADAFGRAVVLYPEALEHTRSVFARMGRTMTANNEKQAWLPEGCTLIPNARGTATGFCLEVGACRLYFMPGVPREMHGMFEHFVLPDLLKRLPKQALRIAAFKTMGLGESKVGALLQDLQAPSPGRLLIQYRAASPEVHVRLVLSGYAEWERAGDEVLDAMCQEVRKRLGSAIFAEQDENLPASLLRLLRSAGASLAVAESCTGGMVGAELTAIPGASDAFWGGVVAYDNRIKQALLGVEEELLTTQGAVSEAVAVAMADGARTRLGTTYGLSVTGVAGPGGGSEAKPVGTVWVGLAGPEGTSARRLFFPGERERIRRYATWSVLDWLRRHLEGAAVSS